MNKVLFITLFLIVFNNSKAQNIIFAEKEDSIVLQADSYTGNIQWEISIDSVIWSNLNNGSISPFKTLISNSPCFYRARIEQVNCEPHYSQVISIKSNYQTFFWSDPAAWLPNNKPLPGENVTIPSTKRIILDENPPALGGLNINGILEFDKQNLELTAQWIMVHGKLQVGSVNEPFAQKAIITLNADNVNQNNMGMGTRGIMVMGGALELHGVSPTISKTKINAHANAGSQGLQLITPVSWQVNDEIIIAPTDYYLAGNGSSVTQKLTLSAVSSDQISFNENLNAFRWGLLQYPTANGMSLSPNNLVNAPSPNENGKNNSIGTGRKSQCWTFNSKHCNPSTRR
jgi:hypothetical protein